MSIPTSPKASNADNNPNSPKSIIISSTEIPNLTKVDVHVDIHTAPHELKNVLLSEFDDSPKHHLDQKLLPTQPSAAATVHWTINKEMKGAFSMALALEVIKDEAEEITIRAESVDNDDKRTSLILKDALFILRPQTFGRTELVISAQMTARFLALTPQHGTPLTRNSLTSSRQTIVRAPKKLSAEKLFDTFITALQNRYRNDKAIDERRTAEFLRSIDTAPPLTENESELIERAIALDAHMADAKRLPTPKEDRVETYLKWKEGTNVAVARCAALIDVNVRTFLADIWVLGTYEKMKLHKKENKGCPRKVWEKIDGSRGLLYVTGVKFPSGFTNRVFGSWITWQRRVKADGREYFIVGFEDSLKYDGSRPDLEELSDSKNFVTGYSSGVHIIEEVTPNTCRFTRTQFVDLRVPFPRPIMEVLAGVQFQWSYQLQEKFLRNAKEVDNETLTHTAKELLGSRTLTAEQETLFNSCAALERSNNNKWVSLKSPNEEVKMWMGTPKSSESSDVKISIRTGKAKGVVDCSAAQVAAWIKDFNSRENLRKSFESGLDVGRRLVDSKTNEITVAMVKKFPFPFRHREFKLRDVFKVEENGDCLIAIKSVNDIEVDYGASVGRTVLAQLTSFWRISNLPVRESGFQQCRITLLQHINAGGRIPGWIINIKIPESLEPLELAMNKFRRDDEFDKVEVNSMTKIMKNGNQEVYSAEELALVDRGIKSFEAFKSLIDSNQYKVIYADDPFVAVKTAHVDNESVVSGQISATMDCELESCAAWEFLKMNREQLKRHKARRGIKKYEKIINNHCKLYMNSRDLGVVGFRPRDFRNKMVWRQIDERKLVLVCEDTNELDAEIPIEGVLGSSKSTFVFERVDSNFEGIPQTKVTMQTRVDIAGSVPTFIMNRLAKRFANNLSMMRKKFDKTPLIEASHRPRLAEALAQIRPSGQEAEAALEQFKALFDTRDGSSKPRESETYQAAATRYHKGWGVSSVGFSTRLDEAAAFLWDYGSRTNTKISGDLERRVTEEAANNNVLTQVVLRKVLDKKNVVHEFKNKMFLHKIDDDTVIIASEPLEMSAGSTKYAIRLRRNGLRPSHTRADLAVEVSLESKSKHGKLLKANVLSLLNEFSRMSIHFHRQMPLDEFEADDGRSLAHDILWLDNLKTRQERLAIVSTSSKALKELEEKYPWFRIMMEKVIEGKLHMNRPVKSKLVAVTESDARHLGKNLIPALRSKKKAETGLDQWTIQNRAIKELLEEHGFLQAFFLTISKGVVKTAAWGLLWRVTVGAVLSVTDLATDITVLVGFYVNSRTEYFEAALMSIVASFLLFLLIVYLQYGKTGWRRILKETAIVLVGMKAPWDAYKVAKGEEKEQGTTLDPLMEMTFNKAAELAAEAIPSVLIQISAIIDDPNDPSKMVLFSVIISALTTGFTSAQISYDFDTDPAKRIQSPDFYGYVPDNPRKRTIIFFALVLMPSFQLLMKGLCFVLLARVSAAYVYAYILADLSLFLALKVIRRDLCYWMRMEGWLMWPICILIRVGIKLITDFTGIVQFRHPNEVGGVYWTLNLLLNLGGLFVALHLCQDTISTERMVILWKLSVMLTLGFVLTFIIFIFNINKKFISTFFSVETGSQMTQRKFFEATDASEKAKAVFGSNYFVWMPIRKDVKLWIDVNWIIWNDDRPIWLTDELHSRIVTDMKKIRKHEGENGKIVPEGSMRSNVSELEFSKGRGISAQLSNVRMTG